MLTDVNVRKCTIETSRKNAVHVKSPNEKKRVGQVPWRTLVVDRRCDELNCFGKTG